MLKMDLKNGNHIANQITYYKIKQMVEFNSPIGESKTDSDDFEDYELPHGTIRSDSDIDFQSDIENDIEEERIVENEIKEIFNRQMSYPPLPRYDTPIPFNPNSPLDKIGLLTPMEEVTEPPSTTGTRTPITPPPLTIGRPLTAKIQGSIRPKAATRSQSQMSKCPPSPIPLRKPVVTFNSEDEIVNIPPTPPSSSSQLNDSSSVPDLTIISKSEEEEEHDNEQLFTIVPDRPLSPLEFGVVSIENENNRGSERPSPSTTRERRRRVKKTERKRDRRKRSLEELEESIRSIENEGRKQSLVVAELKLNTRSHSREKRDNDEQAFDQVFAAVDSNSNSYRGGRRGNSANKFIEGTTSIGKQASLVVSNNGVNSKKLFLLESTSSSAFSVSSTMKSFEPEEEEIEKKEFPRQTERVPSSNNNYNMANNINNTKVVIESSKISSNNSIPSPTSDDSEDTSTTNNQDLMNAEKIQSFDRVRTWNCSENIIGISMPKFSASADTEFSQALDGMITQLHGTKVNWEHRVKLADELTQALKNVSPPTLIKNMGQIIPLMTSIAAESHFRVSLSILNTIMTLGDRIRDCKNFLAGRQMHNADLTWLIYRLCNICGESRSTLRLEASSALSHLIKGAGPSLVCDPLCFILASEKSQNQMNAGPRIKAAALDALTFALLTFPRDNFDLPKLSKYIIKSLLGVKRRVRQASLECLAVIAHALGTSTAMPLFRQFIEESKPENNHNLSAASLNGGNLKQKYKTNNSSLMLANPVSALSARISRHLLPSPSPSGLIEYAVSIPQRGLDRDSSMDSSGFTSSSSGLEPVLNNMGSGKNRGVSTQQMAADIAYILAGTGPTAYTPFSSPIQSNTREWLSAQNGLNHWPSQNQSSSNDMNKVSEHRKTNKVKRNKGYNNIKESLGDSSLMKGDWTNSSNNFMNEFDSNPGSYGQQRFGRGSETLKSEKGFSLLPNKLNKYSSNGTTGPDLPNLSSNSNSFSLSNQNHQQSPFHYNSFNDLNTTTTINGGSWQSSPPPLILSNNSTNKNGIVVHHPIKLTGSPLRHHLQNNHNSHQVQELPEHYHHPISHLHKKFMETRKEIDSLESGGSTKTQEEDSDFEDQDRNYKINQIYTSFAPDGNSGFTKANNKQSYEIYAGKVVEVPQTEGDGGLNSADSGVSSLKSNKMIPDNEINNSQMHEKISSRKKPSPKNSSSNSTSSKQRSNSRNRGTSQRALNGESSSVSNSRNWQSSPNVNEDSLDKTTEIDGEILRKISVIDENWNKSSKQGFHSRKPIKGASPLSKKSSLELIQQQVLQLQDIDSGSGSGSGHGEFGMPRSLSHSNTSLDKEPSPSILQRQRQQLQGSFSMDSFDIQDNIMMDKIPPSSTYLQRKRNLSMKLNSPLRSSENKVFSDGIRSPAEISPPNKGFSSTSTTKKIVPKKIYKGSFRESMTRPTQSNEVFPADLKPVDSPRAGLNMALGQIGSKDWDTVLEAFRMLVRLLRHHPEFVRGELHTIIMVAINHLASLRSQVCKSACLFFRELFNAMGKLMEQDAEKICEKLLDKSADTNKFIKEDSGGALEAMIWNISPSKSLTCLEIGSKHRNAVVRTMAARMTGILVKRVGADRCLYELSEKLLPMLIKFLQEGSLETRTHAKGALLELVRHRDFESQLKKYVSMDTMRHVTKVLASIRNESEQQHDRL